MAGHYARTDVFQLTLRTGIQPMITAQRVEASKNKQSREAAPEQTHH